MTLKTLIALAIAMALQTTQGQSDTNTSSGIVAPRYVRQYYEGTSVVYTLRKQGTNDAFHTDAYTEAFQHNGEYVFILEKTTNGFERNYGSPDGVSVGTTDTNADGYDDAIDLRIGRSVRVGLFKQGKDGFFEPISATATSRIIIDNRVVENP